jgi:hypothetical protein
MSPDEKTGRPTGDAQPENRAGHSTDSSPTVDHDTELEAQIAHAFKLVHDRRAAHYWRSEKFCEAFLEHWHAYDVPGPKGTPRVAVSLPRNWRSSVRGLYFASLSRPELRDSIDVAMEANVADSARFRYLMGVAWRRVREARNEAVARAFAQRGAP